MKRPSTTSQLLFAVALAIPPGRPAIEINGFRMVEAKEAARQIELRARKARLYKPEEIMSLEQLEAQLWGKAKKPYILTGALGILDSASEDFKIFNATEVRTPDGYTFKTSNVKYNQNEHTLSTSDEVDAVPSSTRSPLRFKISGLGLFINLNTRQYEILKNVKTEQKLGPKNSISIRSQNVLINPESNQATFKNAVTVKSPTMNMKGERLQINFSNAPSEDDEGGGAEEALLHPELLILDSPRASGQQNIKATIGDLKIVSKGLKIHLASDGSVLQSEALGSVNGVTKDDVKLKAETLISDVYKGQQRIILKDNVEIITNDRLAHCEESQYFPDSGQIILEKVASVKTSEQLIEGEMITFSTRNSEIVVERAKGVLYKSPINKK